jgi:hypothetical protein
MIAEIRRIVARCKSSERACYEALVEESEGWRARLEELEGEED